MNTELQNRLRKELETERASIADDLRGYGADPENSTVKPQGIDGNFADSAQSTAERAELLSFVDNARERLAAVDQALQRMDEGTYGHCEVCGVEIPEARMEARPMSVRCVEHAS